MDKEAETVGYSRIFMLLLAYSPGRLFVVFD
jgi:hypothetical protein